MTAMPECPANTFGGRHIFVPQVRGEKRCRWCHRTELQAQAMGPRQGATFDAKRDEKRLDGQMLRVLTAIEDGKAHTPKELEEMTGDNWASIGARIRDLRKPQFGRHNIVRDSLGGGLHAYRLVR